MEETRSKQYKIICDSTSDFEIGYRNPNIVIINTPVFIGQTEYTDKTPDEFYERQREAFLDNAISSEQFKTRISTSTPPLGEIEDAMREILEGGQDAIYATMASTLSSTFKAAQIICEDLNDEGFEHRAICIDTLCMSAAGSMLLRTAVEKCDTTEEVLRFILDKRYDIEHLFAVEEFEAFKGSGRYPDTLLSLLQSVHAKPLMRFDFISDGSRHPFHDKMSLSMKLICKRMVNLLKETADPEHKDVIVLHAQNQAAENTLINTVRQKAPDFNLMTGSDFRMGPAVGVHLGHTAIGMIFFRQKGTYENAEKARRELRLEDSLYGYEL